MLQHEILEIEIEAARAILTVDCTDVFTVSTLDTLHAAYNRLTMWDRPASIAVSMWIASEETLCTELVLEGTSIGGPL